MSLETTISVLKSDVFGRVERVDAVAGSFTRRVACGSRVPFSRWLARRLLRREERALKVLVGVSGVPRVEDEASIRARLGANSSSGRRAGTVLLRTWIAGVPLSRADLLHEDFFDHLDSLVLALHARGVCHNDLHKEQNVIVGADGFPWLVDFQLASVHALGSSSLARRAREDLRHVEKHRARYTRRGKGPRGEQLHGRGAGYERSWLARVWRRLGKPVYNTITRGMLGLSDGEERRPSSGPWPAWHEPIGPRGSTAHMDRGG